MTKKQGFTLIELMVSISIIAILTALATISFSSAQKKARDARRTQDMKSLQLAAEQYASSSNGTYPATTAVPWTIAGQPILEAMPFEPKTGDPAYVLSIGATPTTYCFCATMENASAGNATATGIGCSMATTATGNTGPYFCVKNRQ